jgi:hypothetical protein
MAILVLHKAITEVTSGTFIRIQPYYFLVNPKTYTTIETVSGITKVINEDEMNSPITKVEELLRSGVLLRLTASGKSAGNVRKSFYLLVLRSRAGVVQDNLINKIIQGVKITSVISRRKANFY